MNLKRIERFVQTFLDTMGSSPAPGVPIEMRVSVPDESEWTQWRPVDSPISEIQLTALESRVNGVLPRLFKDYLIYKCLLMTDFGSVSLPEIRSDAPWKELGSYLDLYEKTPYLTSNRYFPFGNDSRTGTLVCFSLRDLDSTQDCPILDVDLEQARRTDYSPRVRNPSFSTLLDEIETHLLMSS